MKPKIEEDLKQAQLDRQQLKTSVLRMLLSELKYAEINKGQKLEDPEVITIVQKELKKRHEAAAAFKQGNRQDQAQKEESEAKILEDYLPSQLSDEELTKLIEEAITELEAKGLMNEVGASSIQDMGRVIGLVMGKVGSQAGGSRVSMLVKEKLIS